MIESSQVALEHVRNGWRLSKMTINDYVFYKTLISQGNKNSNSFFTNCVIIAFSSMILLLTDKETAERLLCLKLKVSKNTYF